MDKISEKNSDPSTIVAARRAYAVFCKNGDDMHDGKPCTPWDELTPEMRSHWCAVAGTANKNDGTEKRADGQPLAGDHGRRGTDGELLEGKTGPKTDGGPIVLGGTDNGPNRPDALNVPLENVRAANSSAKLRGSDPVKVVKYAADGKTRTDRHTP